MSEWISVEDRFPNRFEGIKKFKVKSIIGSMTPKEHERVLIGRWYPTGFRFMTSDWERVTHWQEYQEPPQ